MEQRQVELTVTMTVPADVTDEQLVAWLPSIAAQAEEPVYESTVEGEQGFASHDVNLTLTVDGARVGTY